MLTVRVPLAARTTPALTGASTKEYPLFSLQFGFETSHKGCRHCRAENDDCAVRQCLCRLSGPKQNIVDMRCNLNHQNHDKGTLCCRCRRACGGGFGSEGQKLFDSCREYVKAAHSEPSPGKGRSNALTHRAKSDHANLGHLQRAAAWCQCVFVIDRVGAVSNQIRRCWQISSY